MITPPTIKLETNDPRLADMIERLMVLLREMTPQDGPHHFVADRMTIMCAAMGIAIAEICHGDTEARLQEAIAQAQRNIKTTTEGVRNSIRRVQH